MRLVINGEQTNVSTPAELGEFWIQATRQQFREIWLFAPGGPAICALCNGNRGWLMYLREAGDTGFSSRNPDYNGDAEAIYEYRLCNGQTDHYPAAWAIPETDLLQALEHFFVHKQRSPFVTWHEDSPPA